MATQDDEFVQLERKKIQESTTRSLQVLNETLRMGIETTEELERQAESLDRTEANLDHMNHDLDHSKRLMNVIKSPFHSLFNRSSGKKSVDADVKRPQKAASTSKELVQQKQSSSSSQSSSSYGDAVLDQNLEEMSKALHQIRGVGELMSEQLDDSAGTLERIDRKMKNADLKLSKVTKDIKKELR